MVQLFNLQCHKGLLVVSLSIFYVSPCFPKRLVNTIFRSIQRESWISALKYGLVSLAPYRSYWSLVATGRTVNSLHGTEGNQQPRRSCIVSTVVKSHTVHVFFSVSLFNPKIQLCPAGVRENQTGFIGASATLSRMLTRHLANSIFALSLGTGTSTIPGFITSSLSDMSPVAWLLPWLCFFTTHC